MEIEMTVKFRHLEVFDWLIKEKSNASTGALSIMLSDIIFYHYLLVPFLVHFEIYRKKCFRQARVFFESRQKTVL